MTLQPLLYALAVLLIGLAAFGITGRRRVSTALLGAAVFVLAFSWPVLTAGIH